MAATRPTEEEISSSRGDATEARLARWLVRLVSVLAGIGGLAWGYDFGHRVDGVFMGVVAGANLAIMGALLGGAAAEWVLRRMPGRHPRG
jgi:hypothetical protein